MLEKLSVSLEILNFSTQSEHAQINCLNQLATKKLEHFTTWSSPVALLVHI